MTPEQTLRERWNIWAKEKNLCTDCTAMSEEFFLAQFDSMLAEDIVEIKRIKRNYKQKQYLPEEVQDACQYSISILEARRLSLKK